jgi:hypothetical protein
VQWLTAWDEACDTCQGFADLGPVPITGGFDGLDGPPGHPNCLCVILPVVGVQQEAGDVDAVAEDEVVGEPVPQPLPSWESMSKEDREQAVRDDFLQLWKPLMDQHGLQMDFFRYSDSGRQTTVDIKLFNPRGDVIRYTRYIDLNERNVEHAFWTMSRGLQGSGIATDLNNAAFELYKARGIETVTVHANIDVGGYTWAKQGFVWNESEMGTPNVFVKARLSSLELDYPNNQEVLDQVNEIRMRIAEAVQTGNYDNYPQPIDLAMIGHQPGLKTWPGKDEMLGTDWYGIRYL